MAKKYRDKNLRSAFLRSVKAEADKTIKKVVDFYIDDMQSYENRMFAKLALKHIGTVLKKFSSAIKVR